MAGVVGMPTLPKGYRFRLKQARAAEYRHEMFIISLQMNILCFWKQIDYEYVTIYTNPELQAQAIFDKATRLKRQHITNKTVPSAVEQLIKEFNDSSN